jgi:transcriptional regulator with XRE-family HTH domain
MPHRGFEAAMYLNIKLQVFRLGFHQIDIAKALGIDESVLSKIIHGYREPSKTQREQLARYLNAEESWLFEKYDRTLRPTGTAPSLPPSEEESLS